MTERVKRISTHSEHRRPYTYTMARTAGHRKKNNMPRHESTIAGHT